MITFITVEDVNSILGATWTDESKKAKSVLMANTWMNGLNLKIPCDGNFDVVWRLAFVALIGGDRVLVDLQNGGQIILRQVSVLA